MKTEKVIDYIVNWLTDYCKKSGLNGFIVGVSGGVDSAVTSTLCAKTGLKVICLDMPIHQSKEELNRSDNHIKWLKKNYSNIFSHKVELTSTFETFRTALPGEVSYDGLSMANARSRIRMVTLYAIGQAHDLLVAGTGNKVEDFGVGFFTKYGDGGVDLSPIADLMKTEVYQIAKALEISDEIIQAAPRDGLWMDRRTDEEHIGASYSELEWAMTFDGVESDLSDRQKKVLEIYRRHHSRSIHKIEPIPVCKIPDNLKED